MSKENLKEPHTNPLEIAVRTAFGTNRKAVFFENIAETICAEIGMDQSELAKHMQENGDQIIVEVGRTLLQKEKLLNTTYARIDDRNDLTPEQKTAAKAFASSEKLWEAVEKSVNPAIQRAEMRLDGKQNDAQKTNSALGQLLSVFVSKPAAATDTGTIKAFSFGRSSHPERGESGNSRTKDIIGGICLMTTALCFEWISIAGINGGINTVHDGMGVASAIGFGALELGLMQKIKSDGFSAEDKIDKIMLPAVTAAVYGLDILATYVFLGATNDLPPQVLDMINNLALRITISFLAAVIPEWTFLQAIDMFEKSKKK